LLSRALPGIAGIAKDDLADYLGKLDEHYLGVARPLRWDALEWLEGYSRPLLRSRLRIYEKSFARYGAEAVAGIENAMAKSVLLGTPWTEARESVMGLVREQVGGRQWMVDRIVRTEISSVHSAVTMAALLEEDEPDDPMLKKLVALWDKVTGLDSKLLHGQTRRVQELFTDVVRGKQFDAPPNRPNDREIVIGWRSSWGDDAGFDADTRNADGSADDVHGDSVDVSAAIDAASKGLKVSPLKVADLPEPSAEAKAKRERVLKVVEPRRAKAKAAATMDGGIAWDLRMYGDGGVIPAESSVVWVDPAKLDPLWITGRVERGGIGGIGDRYQEFQWFASEADMPIQPSEIEIGRDGKIEFVNGRHRFAVIRDAGIEKIPIVVSKDQAARLKSIAGAK
jgi:hypothetical protein